MQYMFLIYDNEQEFAQATEAERQQIFAAYEAFSRELRDRSAMIGGNALQPSSAATVVRLRDGELSMSDGPFVPGGEQLGGYYLVECADPDEALELAGRVPSAALGAVEVRPLMEVTAVTVAEAQR